MNSTYVKVEELFLGWKIKSGRVVRSGQGERRDESSGREYVRTREMLDLNVNAYFWRS